MNNRADSESDAESVVKRPEYDFSGGVRGKYAERYARSINVDLLDADVADTEATKDASIAPPTEDPT